MEVMVVSTAQPNQVAQVSRDLKFGVETCYASHDYSSSNDVPFASVIFGILQPWSMAQGKTIPIECWCIVT